MIYLTPEEEAVIAQAKRAMGVKGRIRVIPAYFGAIGLGMSFWVASKLFSKIENMEEVSEGFVAGLGLCVVLMSFGIMGAICLAKAITGFKKDFEEHELLLKLHRELSGSTVEQAEALDPSSSGE